MPRTRSGRTTSNPEENLELDARRNSIKRERRINPVASKKKTKELSEKKTNKEEKLYARKGVSLLELLEVSAANNEKELKAQQDDSAIFSGSSAEREIVTTKKVPLRHQKSIVISLEDNYEDKMANELQPKRLFAAARVLRSSTKTTKK